MTKTLKDLTSEIAKLKWESKQPNITFQGAGNRNQNQFRRPNDAPQVMQRERRNVDDQRVVPPFQNNHIEEIDADNDVVDDTVVLFNETDYYTSHLTQQEYEVAQLSNQFDDQIGEEGVIQGQPKKKYDLRMRNGASKATTSDQGKQVEAPPKPNPNKGMPSKTQSSPLSKPLAPETKEADKPPTFFSLEHELRKIKIPVPLTELLKNEPFKKSIMKVLQPTPSSVSSDVISLQDENPAITVGPHIEDGSDASPPFYISLNVHDKILHNCLMDSGASHNVMPKVVMEELGLEITKPYQDLYSFDSKKVKCLGLIKDMVVSLAQLPMKSVVMDIVVADIPPKFGMLLSRTWAKKVGGSLQMDLTYATIPVFGGEHRRLYREVRLAYIVSDHQNPRNHPIYVVEDEMGSSVFHLNDDEPEISVSQRRDQPMTGQQNKVWKMYFDGSSSKEGSGAVFSSFPLQKK
jgi:hypothetical protein